MNPGDAGGTTAGEERKRGWSRRLTAGWGAVRTHASMVFLALGVALLGVAVFQALAEARRHRATVDRVLMDYAGVAGWSYEERLGFTNETGYLPRLLENLFHYPLHQRHERSSTYRASDVQESLPHPHGLLHHAGEIYAEDRSGCANCRRAELGAITFAMRFSLKGGAGDMAGEPPPGMALDEVREAVRRHDRTHGTLRRSEGAVAGRFGGRPYLILYSRQLGVGDTVLYAVALDSAAAAPVFEAAFAGAPLLPAPLMGERANDDFVSLRLTTVDDGAAPPLFESRPAVSTAGATKVERVHEPLGLRLVVTLRDEAAQRLIIGGPPASRLPLLLGLLALAGGLLVVGFGQLRREHALARLRGDFVASVSHELRTPLAVQRVFLDTLRLGRARTDEQREWSLENVDRESTRLAHLVENVLQFSRAEQRQLRMTLVPTDLTAVLRDAATAYAPLAVPAGATLALRVEGGVVAPADADAMRQVLMNLLENATKYGPRGQTITVTLTLVGEKAVITVDDEGPGVSPREREGVFEPFRRGAGTVGSAVAGSGIGLSVVRQVVRLHGGNVEIQDAPGGGARVRVELPEASRAEGEREATGKGDANGTREAELATEANSAHG
jgi:signal transduction histidine kinase